MPSEDSSLLKLARAVADGTSVEWSQEVSAATGPDEQAIVRELQAVAGVAEAHQGIPAEETFATPVVPSSPVPTAWGRLEIRREIGRGGFGTVYLAWDPVLERHVALKVLRAHDRSAAVVQEGRLLARVRHPGVVSVYGVDEHDGSVGLWMEFVEGLTLNQILAARGAFDARETLLVGIDICRAVAAVHKAGLLHRDIKAQNVMREPGGRIVLMDLGAGEVRTDRVSSELRLTGTPLYLAPEIFDNKPGTIASDIYSLGVLLYYLLTLRYPVEGDTFDAVEAAHASGRAVPLGDRRPDLPLELVRVIECALNRDPARRHRSAGALQEDLAEAVARLYPPESSVVPAGVTPSAGARLPSVAVLPFENLGPDQDLEYFCTGLAEELLTGLGKVQGLRVASRTSSLHVKQRETDIRRICRLLEVDAVLEGTVRQAGDRLRITAQLVSAEDGCHLWSEGYDRSVADVFAVQDEIAHSVVDRLKISLAQFPSRQLIRQHTHNPRAYQLYLKGRFFWTRRFQGGFLAALEHFQKAIEEDAAYALAYAGLADAYSFMGTYSVQLPRTALAHALAAAERALALDADLAEAHTSLAWIKLADWNWPEAEREFRRALELDPTQVLPRVYHSSLMVLQGDAAGAMLEARKAQELEPLSPLVNASAGHTAFLARRYDEAVAECEKSLEVDPNFILGIHVMGMCRALQSQLDEAIQIGERTVSMSGRAPFYLGVLGHYYARSGAADKVNAIITELERVASTRYVPPHSFAYIYAGANDLDRAFEWQAKAYEDGASPFYYFAPLIDNMQADPRHSAELKRMGLNRNS
jgi:TolB-like protein/tetratricopeptide (TPR) repeat protein